jgi:hypothetical protein
VGGVGSTYGEGRGVYRVLVGNLRERDHLEDPGVNGRIILRWIFGNWEVKVWTVSFSIRTLPHGVSK